MFDGGGREAAIAELEELRQQDLSVEEQSRVGLALAQMRLVQGDEEAARALVEAVLEADPGEPEALKMRAGWLIQDDETDRAIGYLRTALDSAPDDAEALTLMAQAHTRNGNRQLAREFLALAVEASGSAPAETLRYARVLVEEERYLRAEELVIEALRLVPSHFGLLTMLGDIYVRLEDWPRAEQVERSLRDAGTEAAMRQADSLRTAILAGQGQTDEALAYLESLAAEAGTSDLGAQIAVIRARLATGERGRALAFAEELLADNPEDPVHRFVVAAVRGATGDQAGAEELYRSLVEAVPQIPEAWLGLIRSMHAQGQTEAAWAVLEEALEVLPDAPDLLWAQASYRERLGDYEGAIAIYERLYEMLPASPVVANNLASLISTYRDDDESLDRAYSIARRLRGSDVPQFQDTYGWIAYRRGDHEEAVEHLEPAAAELAEDPLVQFHLGMTYLALEREEEALEQLRLAAELAGPGDTRSQFAIARDRISELEAVASEAATTEGE
jgi:tetratricopeptide (TPR) repeat protein